MDCLLFFALEAWIVGSSLEKVDIGLIQVFEFLLQDLAIGLLEPVVLWLVFQFLQVVVAVKVAQTLTGLPVVASAQAQPPVVHEPGVAELHRHLCRCSWLG
jgi:hypothetical protein